MADVLGDSLYWADKGGHCALLTDEAARPGLLMR